MDLTTERPRARASAETPRELAGEVVGSALYRLTAADVPNIRKQPGPVPAGSTRAAATLLRHSDHQTIAATAALYSAMSAMGMTPEAFVDWGVVAATRYLGRSHLAVAVRKFDVEGVWGVSPHLIPHFALHSTSGTLSLALGIHGPNLGVGGGAHSEVEGFLASLTWLAAGVVPGVWLVLTGWEPELETASPIRTVSAELWRWPSRPRPTAA
jgi:3-oxoacyl-(acyl-carrier-protein) synthase